jgi:hypothetical protein
MPLLCGCPNAGPRASSNCTDAANDTCSTSVRLAHQPPNSSVYSTSQAMHEYSLRGIFRQVHFLDATLPHTTRKRATGYNYNVEGQKSAPSREVIRFILYLSIHLPDTRSTFQSQRVFFIEDATLSGGFLALTGWLHIQVQDLQRLRPNKIQVSGLASLIEAL